MPEFTFPECVLISVKSRKISHAINLLQISWRHFALEKILIQIIWLHFAWEKILMQIRRLHL